MSLIVQKYGGSSVADAEKIRGVAQRVVATADGGHGVVVVVSAMGKTTDSLIRLAHEVTSTPNEREMDMLLSTGEQVSVALMAMAIESLGYKAAPSPGRRSASSPTAPHQGPHREHRRRPRSGGRSTTGKIVIVAGFQGIDASGNITTLGRGGSDTTAVALAAVLEADVCEIYTDVDGVYTTDPGIVPGGPQDRPDQLRRDAGAGQPGGRGAALPVDRVRQEVRRAVHVRSTFNDRRRYLVTREDADMEGRRGHRDCPRQERGQDHRSDGRTRPPGHRGQDLRRVADAHRRRHDRPERQPRRG